MAASREEKFPALILSAGGDEIPHGGDITAFDQSVAGESVPVTLTLRNAGRAALTLDGANPITLSGTDAGLFSLPILDSTVIAPLSRMDVILTFNPGSAGDKSARLSIASDDPDHPVYSVEIVAAVIDGPRLEVSLDGTALTAGGTLSFDWARPGRAETQTLTLSNAGFQDLIITEGSIAGAHGEAYSLGSLAYPLTLPKGQSRDLTVTLGEPGDSPLAGVLTFTSNDGDSPFNQSLSYEPWPELAVYLGSASGEPLLHNQVSSMFSSVSPGERKNVTILVANEGALDLSVDRIPTLFQPGSHVQLLFPLDSSNLEPGRQSSFDMAFTAPATAEELSGSLVIKSGDSSASAGEGFFTLRYYWNAYDVTFDTGGGTGFAPQVVLGNAAVADPGNPVKSGETFAGWYSDSSYTQPWDMNDDVVDGDLTLYARWTLGATHTVTYHANGAEGALPSAQTKLTGEDLILAGAPENLTLAGHVFSGWNTDSLGSGTAYGPGSTYSQEADLLLYAQWEPASYTIGFDTGGGTPEPADQLVEYNGTASRPATDPARDHYTFNNWYHFDLTTPWDFSDPVTGDDVIYAGWTPDQHLITFDGNGADGGSLPADQTVDYAGLISAPTEQPTLTDKNFAGWFDASTGGEQWDFSTRRIYGDRTIYAQWSDLPTYTVSYDGNGSDGGTVPTNETFQQGSGVIIKDKGTMTRAGHTFSGWENTGGTSYGVGAVYSTPADLELLAQWDINSYTISFNTDGGTSIDSQTVEYGSAGLQPLADPEKTGYSFDGWFDAEYSGSEWSFDTAITDDTVLYAYWTPDTYPVRYYDTLADSGAVPADQVKTYNASLVLAGNTGNLARPGYDLTGWNTQSDGQGTNYGLGSTYTGNTALDLYAKWTADPPAAPDSPTILVGDGTFTVSWDAVANTADYTVAYHTADDSSAATIVDNVMDVDQTDEACTITGLVNDTLYWVWVKANNPGGSSAYSASTRSIPLAGGTNHNGADLIIDANQSLGGTHYNVGTFRVDSGVTLTLDAYNGTSDGTGSLNVYAQSIDVQGSVNASGKGYRGGAQGNRGNRGGNNLSGPVDGGAGSSNSGEKPSGASGSNGGSGGSGGSGGGVLLHGETVDCTEGSISANGPSGNDGEIKIFYVDTYAAGSYSSGTTVYDNQF